MTLYTPISQLPYPNGPSDPPAASQILALATAVERLAPMKFATVAARTSALPAPTEGMISYRLDTHAFEFYNGTAWTALFGYNTLARTKSIRPAITTNNGPNFDITSTSPISYTTGNMTFTKQYPQSALRLHIEHSGYIPNGLLSGTELYCVINMSGGGITAQDYQFADFMFGVVSAHQTFVGTYDVAVGVAANTYTFQLKYRLNVSGGTPARTIRMDSNDPLFMSVEEIAAL